VSQSRDGSLHGLVHPLLSDHRPEISAATARTLGEIGALAAIADLKPLLSAADPRLRLESATALARLSHPSGLKYLHELLENSDPLTQVEAALRLLELGDLAGSPLLKRITSARSELRSAVAERDRLEEVPDTSGARR
jgi:HEAT repeat protein